MLKNFALVVVPLSILYVIVLLGQIWGDLFSAEIFIKLSLSYIILVVLVGGIYALFKEVRTSEKSQKDNLLG